MDHRVHAREEGVRQIHRRVPEHALQAGRGEDRGDGGARVPDHCLELFLAGELDATTAAMGKWWLSELDNKVLDTCLQLFGGYGYMLEYPIARAYADARVHRIYAGTTEIMKELVARSL